jgi:hypothetical protein
MQEPKKWLTLGIKNWELTITKRQKSGQASTEDDCEFDEFYKKLYPCLEEQEQREIQRQKDFEKCGEIDYWGYEYNSDIDSEPSLIINNDVRFSFFIHENNCYFDFFGKDETLLKNFAHFINSFANFNNSRQDKNFIDQVLESFVPKRHTPRDITNLINKFYGGEQNLFCPIEIKKTDIDTNMGTSKNYICFLQNVGIMYDKEYQHTTKNKNYLIVALYFQKKREGIRKYIPAIIKKFVPRKMFGCEKIYPKEENDKKGNWDNFFGRRLEGGENESFPLL